MEITQKNDPNFLRLSSYVRNGEYKQIDDWFKKYNISKNKDLEKILTLKILNTPYFFSFSTTSVDGKYLKEERVKREVAVLRNLKIENQLLLFSVASISNVKSEHVKEIKLNSKNKKILEKSKRISSVITKLFWEENFSEINKIQEILQFNVMEQKVSGAIFNYREENTHGSFFINIREPIFSPKYDIVFNYSERKKKFLDEKLIALPTLEEALNLYNKIKQSFESNDVFIKEKIDISFREYEIQKGYWDLKKILPNNLSLNKKNKI